MARAERKGDSLKDETPGAGTSRVSDSNDKAKETSEVQYMFSLTMNQDSDHGSYSTFEFDGYPVRAFIIDGDPWFSSEDICAALQIVNHRDAMVRLDEDEKGVALTDTLGGKQQIGVVNESGMFTLVLRCRKAVEPGTVPHRFRKWVTGEVLPALRKTGHYGVDEGRLNEAFMLASEVAQQAARTVFDTLMDGDGNWESDRWLFSFTTDPQGRTVPYASVIEREANVASMERLAEMITMPGGLYPSERELAVLAEACTKRLSQMIEFQSRKRLAGGVA